MSSNYTLYIRPYTFDGVVTRIDVIDKESYGPFFYSEDDKSALMQSFADKSLIIRSVGSSSYIKVTLTAITVSNSEVRPYMLLTFRAEDHGNQFIKSKIFSK